MPRKSQAALSVVPPTKIDGRPKAPAEFSDAQKEIWDRIVANEHHETFKTASLQMLLKELVRHATSADRLTKLIEEVEKKTEFDSKDLEDLERLIRMRARETSAMADKATKLRLTNQSRYNTRTAGSRAKQAAEPRKPWHVE